MSIAIKTTAGAVAKRRPRIVILGSGWAAFTFLRRIDKTKFDVVCVSPSNHFLFTPLLPSSAVGTIEFRAIQEPIRGVLSGATGTYYQAKARTCNFAARTLECEEIFQGTRFSVSYDALVLATGCKTNTFNTPGIHEREGKEVFFLKHLYHARQIRHRILECFERAAILPKERDRLLHFLVVGGGPTAVEFVGELNDFVMEDAGRFFPHLRPHIRVTIVEATGHLLGAFDKKLVSYVEKKFLARGISVRLNSAVTSLSDDGTTVSFSDGTTMQVGMLVWSAGLAPVKFIENLPVERATPSRRVLIDSHLAVNTPACEGRVFALGDCAVNAARPLAQLAQVAKSQAKWLADALNKTPTEAFMQSSPPSSTAAPTAVVPTLADVINKNNQPYRYAHLISMATLGGWKGVVDFSQVSVGKTQLNLGYLTGFFSFIIWRSAYLGGQVSNSNKLLIPIYWLKSWIWGRDVSSF